MKIHKYTADYANKNMFPNSLIQNVKHIFQAFSTPHKNT